MYSQLLGSLQYHMLDQFLSLGGRIDHGHHDNRPKRALTDTLMLQDAVQKAVDLTSEKETLIVVTADHGHEFTVGGYPQLHTDILSMGFI